MLTMLKGGRKNRHKRAHAVSFHLYNMQKEVQLIYTARNQKNWAIFLEIVIRKGHKGAFAALVTFFFLHWVVAL